MKICISLIIFQKYVNNHVMNSFKKYDFSWKTFSLHLLYNTFNRGLVMLDKNICLFACNLTLLHMLSWKFNIWFSSFFLFFFNSLCHIKYLFSQHFNYWNLRCNMYINNDNKWRVIDKYCQSYHHIHNIIFYFSKWLAYILILFYIFFHWLVDINLECKFW